MTEIEWWINLIGLVLTLIGSGYMFLATMKEDIPKYSQLHVGSYESLEAERKKLIDLFSLRRRTTIFGFSLLSIGIILQTVSFLMQYPD